MVQNAFLEVRFQHNWLKALRLLSNPSLRFNTDTFGRNFLFLQCCAVRWELTGSTEGRPGYVTTSEDSDPGFVDAQTLTLGIA